MLGQLPQRSQFLWHRFTQYAEEKGASTFRALTLVPENQRPIQHVELASAESAMGHANKNFARL